MKTDIPTWIDGKLTPVEKLDAHRRGLRHMAVSVFVISGSSVLLQRRALGKYHTPGLWANTCCTHPQWDEPARDCATRRLREELGIEGLTLEHRGQVEYRADVGNGLIEHELVDIFVAEAPPDLKLRPDPDEVMDVEWCDLYALRLAMKKTPARYTPWLRIYLNQHARQIFPDG